MPKRNRYNRSDTIGIEKKLIKSEAWQTLKGRAPQIYTLFLLRRQWEKVNGKWKCYNLREIVFPYREAKEKFKVSRKQFLCCIDNLIAHGFLDIVKPGIAINRVATVYGMSRRWERFGTMLFTEAKRPKGTCGYPPRPRKDMVIIE